MELLELLKPGICGYLSWSGGRVEDPVVDRDIKVWLSACHARVRRMGGRIGRLSADQIDRRFQTLEVNLPLPFGKAHIVLHSVLPLVAALRHTDFRDDEEYLDCPLLAEDLGVRFTILQKSILDRPFALEPWMERVLDPGSLSDIRLWKPRRVGDLVFNHYD